MWFVVVEFNAGMKMKVCCHLHKTTDECMHGVQVLFMHVGEHDVVSNYHLWDGLCLCHQPMMLTHVHVQPLLPSADHNHVVLTKT